MLNCLRAIVCGAMLIAAGHGAADEAYFAKPKTLDLEGFSELFSQVAPNVLIGGQPTEFGLARARALGVTTVVNLRTQREVDNREMVPYDEAEALALLGLDYVRIPQGGPDTPYAPDAVSRFAQTVSAADGKVLLHCTVGWRATHLWTAYLVRHHDLSVPEAIAIGRQLNLGRLPLEGLLGEELVIDVK